MKLTRYFAVCASMRHCVIMPIIPKEHRKWAEKVRFKNKVLNEQFGEQPWAICANKRPTTLNNGLSFVPCGYSGQPEIWDERTQIAIYVLNK